ncbi:MAG TPA: hypothetical protein PLW77_06370 [Bacteroidales bacterium]|nr:hypothetical protein [Bacteroidales bacterium]HQB21911.1 hypothetical protein [Bacteroidales bacterium]
MKKDIFIDNNVANKFANPQDKEYKKLTKWLLNFNVDDIENKNNYAHLVVSKKLLAEYLSSSIGASSNTAIPMIISTLQRQGRLVMISNSEIKNFQHKYYKKTIVNNFRSNSEDREHIPVVLLSDRKYALSYDTNFIHDLETFPGFNVIVKKRPEEIPYDK